MIFPIEKMCKVFNVSTSGYYNWRNSAPSKWILQNKDITKRIISIHKESKGTYGSPMITKQLNKDAIKVSRPRVARLMKASKIHSKRKKKFVITTDLRH